MKILLTGGTGQLGKTILGQFKNCDLYAPTRENMDLTDRMAVEGVMSAFKPDVIVNAAAWTNVPQAEMFPEKAFKVNLEAVKVLAQAGSRFGAKFIQISTDYVFDGESSSPYKENDGKNPLSLYGLSKSMAEDYLQTAHADEAYVIRTSWLYSRYGSNFVKSILKKLVSTDTEIEVVSDQYGSPTLARDLAKALELFCKNKYEPGLYHFSNSGYTNWHSFACAIADYSQLNSGRVVPVASQFSRDGVTRPAFSVLDLSKYTLITGNTPPEWQESLRDELPEIRAEVEQGLRNEV